jgi:hypothetical protein
LKPQNLAESVGIYLEMGSQSLPLVELLVAVREVANEFRIRVIVQMSAEVVHAGEEFAAELAGHDLVAVRLDVLLEIL